MKLNPRRTRREVDQTETAISELDSPTFLAKRTDGPGAGGVLRADAVGNRNLKDLADEVRVGQDAHVALPAAVTLLDAHDDVVRVVRGIGPWRPFVWGGWRARKVLETAASEPASPKPRKPETP